jgi:hypothetical protein
LDRETTVERAAQVGPTLEEAEAVARAASGKLAGQQLGGLLPLVVMVFQAPLVEQQSTLAAAAQAAIGSQLLALRLIYGVVAEAELLLQMAWLIPVVEEVQQHLPHLAQVPAKMAGLE